MRDILKWFLYLAGASGAIAIFGRMGAGGEFAEALNTGNWGVIIGTLFGALIVVGCFWLVSKLSRGKSGHTLY